jgi:phosphopantetheinyl transferase
VVTGNSPNTGLVQFIDELPGWARMLPAVLIQTGSGAEQRRASLKALVARALSVNPDLVQIDHVPDRPPIVSRPMSAGLYLSAASRGPIAAMAASREPVGVDVEVVEPDAEIPFNLLHAHEAVMLRSLSGRMQAMAFSRLWSLKEAYLKSLGVGLQREPSSFSVRFVDGEVAEIADPVQPVSVLDARTTWRASAGIWAAVSAVALIRIRS